VARGTLAATELAMKHLRKADDRIERRPQLVADRGNEGGLGPACALGFLACLPHGDRVPAARRDIAHDGNSALGIPPRLAAELDPARRRSTCNFHFDRNRCTELNAL